VGRLSCGSLQNSITNYVYGKTHPESVTWHELKQFIITNFLGQDEMDYLRTQLQQLHQSSYEPTEAFTRRFFELAEKAYSPEQLKLPLISAKIIKDFIQSLSSTSVKTQIFLQKPDTFQKARDAAMTASRAYTLAFEQSQPLVHYGQMQSAVKQLAASTPPTLETRNIENMDCSALNFTAKPALTSHNNPEALITKIASLTEAVSLMGKNVNKIEAALFKARTTPTAPAPPRQPYTTPAPPAPAAPTAPPPNTRPNRKFNPRPQRNQYTTDNRDVVCFYCMRKGHKKPACPVLNQKIPIVNQIAALEEQISDLHLVAAVESQDEALQKDFLIEDPEEES
jgi:hypothetical protein